MTDTSLKTYGEDVFSEKAIRAHLSKTVAAKLLATMRKGEPLDPTIADAVAEGMKNWALKKSVLNLLGYRTPNWKDALKDFVRAEFGAAV